MVYDRGEGDIISNVMYILKKYWTLSGEEFTQCLSLHIAI